MIFELSAFANKLHILLSYFTYLFYIVIVEQFVILF